ncbi:MAG: alpha/beta hydrolase [Desulfovibrio sp.]|jgi:acetyl esterase/lipase|nr:alpha/beta hydrolase [Desulfovibrio sp.]
MRHATFIVHTVLLALLAAAAAGAREIPPRTIPVPTTVSPALRPLVAVDPFTGSYRPKTPEQWKADDEAFARREAANLPNLCRLGDVTVEEGTAGGVRIYTITPNALPPENANRILIHLHGGGYVFGSGEGCMGEGILMAGLQRYRVVSVDYRLAPGSPFPAAVDDALAAYREIEKRVGAKRIGVFGSSAGGGLTLALALRIKAEGLPMPAALGCGSPWTDLTKTGDSYYANDTVDNVLVHYEGWLEDAAKTYAGATDMRNPLLSPVNGDVQGLPPTILASGTRDLFLSNTVRMHTKLRDAGIPADLLVFEAQSHVQYLLSFDALETQRFFREFGKFFDRHLEK